MSRLQMTQAEREEFLGGRRVCVLAVEQPGGPPLLVPVWYRFENGLVTIHTARGQLKTELLERAGRFAVCVQSEEVPYRYVSAEGPIVAVEPVPADEREAMVYRYFPGELGAQYLEQTAADAPNDVAVRMRPERWRSVDFSKTSAGF